MGNSIFFGARNVRLVNVWRNFFLITESIMKKKKYMIAKTVDDVHDEVCGEAEKR
jgi:hypothetical protein